MVFKNEVVLGFMQCNAVVPHHFTVFKNQQEGNGLNTLPQALQDVRML